MPEAPVTEVDLAVGLEVHPGGGVAAAIRLGLQALFESRRLSPAQRRMARYLLEHAEEAPFLTSVDLAQQVGVSQPSATRFAAALGFGGYPDLRDAMRSWMLRPHAEFQTGEGRNDFQRMIGHEIRNLAALGEALQDPAVVLEVGRQLASSRPLVVVGLRVSAPIASHFAFFARKVHPDTRLVSESGSAAEDLITQARDAGASCALVFGLPRYPGELLTLMGWARRSGLRLCLITDQAVSPLAEAADITLAAAVGTDLVFDSQAAPMVLCMVVLQAMFDNLPGSQQQRIEDFETRAAERQIFIAP